MTLTERRPLTRRPPVLRPEEPRSAADPAGRRWTLGRLFTLGASVVALLSVVAIIAGVTAMARLTNARETLLDEVGPALLASRSLSVALLNQETAIRGFALSRDESFLEPYRTGVTEEQAAIATMRDRLADRPDVLDEVQAVQGAVAAWHTAYAEATIESVRAGGVAVDPALGKARFDEVRAPLTVLTDDLESERIVGRAQLNAAADELSATGITVAVVALLVLVAATLGLRRGILAPVSSLAAQVRDVVGGEVNRPVGVDGPREIVELGADVEAMRVHISREVDLLQEANRRLDDQARDLERSNRDLEQFAYVASHDLQEPLRKVSSFCQLLQRRYGGQLDDRADQYIGFAVDGAMRMQRLINDLLAFSRVGRTTSGFEAVDLAEIGPATVAQLEVTCADVGGTVELGELPRVQGDPALLRQLLLNLVGNGLKFHRPDVPPAVRVDARRDGEHWELAVTDNGIGIEPEYADKIFVIFQRLHGREVYTGTGIGLALAKKIVEFHGGRIWLDTTPRAEPGTVIRFTLPVEGAGPESPASVREQA